MKLFKFTFIATMYFLGIQWSQAQLGLNYSYNGRIFSGPNRERDCLDHLQQVERTIGSLEGLQILGAGCVSISSTQVQILVETFSQKSFHPKQMEFPFDGDQNPNCEDNKLTLETNFAQAGHIILDSWCQPQPRSRNFTVVIDTWIRGPRHIHTTNFFSPQFNEQACKNLNSSYTSAILTQPEQKFIYSRCRKIQNYENGQLIDLFVPEVTLSSPYKQTPSLFEGGFYADMEVCNHETTRMASDFLINGYTFLTFVQGFPFCQLQPQGIRAQFILLDESFSRLHRLESKLTFNSFEGCQIGRNRAASVSDPSIEVVTSFCSRKTNQKYGFTLVYKNIIKPE